MILSSAISRSSSDTLKLDAFNFLFNKTSYSLTNMLFWDRLLERRTHF